MRFLESPLSASRIGIVVPMAISKKAVIRNRIKRLISAVIKELDYSKKYFDIIITASPPIVGKSVREIKSEFEKVIKTIYGQVKNEKLNP